MFGHLFLKNKHVCLFWTSYLFDDPAHSVASMVTKQYVSTVFNGVLTLPQPECQGEKSRSITLSILSYLFHSIYTSLTFWHEHIHVIPQYNHWKQPAHRAHPAKQLDSRDITPRQGIESSGAVRDLKMSRTETDDLMEEILHQGSTKSS